MSVEKQAQIELMNWLIGQCTDQMVTGWLITQKRFIELPHVTIGTPTGSDLQPSDSGAKNG